MSQTGTMSKSQILIPFAIALIAALIAFSSWFFPYISFTDDYAKYIEIQGEKQVFDSVDFSYRELKNLSLFKYAKIYSQGGKEIFQSESTGTFYGVLLSSIAVLSLLVFLAVLKRKPILTFVLNALLSGVCYSVDWDFVDRGIMPGSDRVWGISYYMLYVCVAVIALSSIWMFIEKRKMKKERNSVFS